MSEREDRDMERWLGNQLQPHYVPGADATWQRIAPLLDTTPRRRLPGLVTQLAATMGAIMALATVLWLVWPMTAGGGSLGERPASGPQGGQPAAPAVAASSTVVAVPARASALDSLAELQPAPPFQVLRPTYLPPGARLAAAVYHPGAPAMPTRLTGPDTDSAVAVVTEQRVQQLLGDGQGAMLILIYTVGPDQFLELVQRPASASPWPVTGGAAQMPGELATARGARAALTQRDGREVLSWIDIASPASETSFVEVLTTRGRAEAVQVANGLQNVKPPVPRPSVLNIVPLEQRTKVVREPKASPETIASECGPWPMAAVSANQTSDLPTEARARIDCTARLTAGIAATSPARFNVGIGRADWRTALARYVLTPANDLPGNPAVWVVTVGVSEVGGNIVIIDAATGDPLLLAELLP